MISRLRGWVVGAVVLMMAIGYLVGSGPTNAADDKGMADTIKKIAAALEKKDSAEAKKLADTLKGSELEDVMHLMALRTKKGLGVGPKPGAITPDGMEKKLIELAKKPLDAKQLSDESAALAELGYNTAAIAQVALAKTPDKDEGKKKKKDWIALSDDMIQGGLQLAAAAKEKNAAGVQKAAIKLDRSKMESNCNKCHDIFRE